MYHEGSITSHAYYDTLEEMPKTAKVFFPGKEEPVEMTADEIRKLDNEGWYTVMHSVNFGVCDHWTSEKPSKWVRERFEHILHYTSNGKADCKIIGYNRSGWSLTLTKDAHVWHAEVWNS